ncbi:hypothetical protein BJ170DRAFT_696062 [Xylariales sp. AK1849]|nr:hypothetical protein BJ170DRAFT_696062 [Xylariales sp. AK1849]
MVMVPFGTTITRWPGPSAGGQRFWLLWWMASGACSCSARTRRRRRRVRPVLLVLPVLTVPVAMTVLAVPPVPPVLRARAVAGTVLIRLGSIFLPPPLLPLLLPPLLLPLLLLLLLLLLNLLNLLESASSDFKSESHSFE